MMPKLGAFTEAWIASCLHNSVEILNPAGISRPGPDSSLEPDESLNVPPVAPSAVKRQASRTSSDADRVALPVDRCARAPSAPSRLRFAGRFGGDGTSSSNERSALGEDRLCPPAGDASPWPPSNTERVYAPSEGEARYRVVATGADGRRNLLQDNE